MKNSFIVFYFLWISISSQNETKKWYFGNFAALDFMTAPPTILINSSMGVVEGCASMADGSGSLLFYTNGQTVWNKNNSIMANGQGLNGSNNPSQSSLILKKPGSTSLYYIFTVEGAGGFSGLNYSIVDMSLAAGLGSLTTLNAPVYIGQCAEKLSAIKHCNGIDYWVLVHELNTNNYRAYLFSSAGVTYTAVISSVGSVHNSFGGCMKISPTGAKIGSVCSGSVGTIELLDFDNYTGNITNPVLLGNGSYAYGCEFSPNGTKFYCGMMDGLHQWNLCGGTPSVVTGSDLIVNPVALTLSSLQLASNGKIYVARLGKKYIAAINDPNLVGMSCNYVDSLQDISPNTSAGGLPNFAGDYFKSPVPFTYTIGSLLSCQTVSFTSHTPCLFPNNGILSLDWNFGDPASGTLNTSSLEEPIHQFTVAGSYQIRLVIQHPCYNDTLLETIIIPQKPVLTLSGDVSLCKGETTTLTAQGADTYTWNSILADPTIIITPTFTTTYTVIGTNSLNACATVKQTVVSVDPCTLVGEITELNYGARIYPNPFSEELILVINGEDCLVNVYDIVGKLIVSTKYGSGAHKINLEHCSPGVYFIDCNGPEGFYKLKLIKER